MKLSVLFYSGCRGLHAFPGVDQLVLWRWFVHKADRRRGIERTALINAQIRHSRELLDISAARAKAEQLKSELFV